MHSFGFVIVLIVIYSPLCSCRGFGGRSGPGFGPSSNGGRSRGRTGRHRYRNGNYQYRLEQRGGAGEVTELEKWWSSPSVSTTPRTSSSSTTLSTTASTSAFLVSSTTLGPIDVTSEVSHSSGRSESRSSFYSLYFVDQC